MELAHAVAARLQQAHIIAAAIRRWIGLVTAAAQVHNHASRQHAALPHPGYAAECA